MNIESNKKKFMSLSSSKEEAVPSKISIYTKPIILKGISSLLLLLFIMFPATQANASFFSGISQFFGIGAQASENTLNDTVSNSQNIPLMESNLTPELKNSQNNTNMTIIGDQALEPNNVGALGVSDIDQKYATSRKIQVHTIEFGDTLEKISKQFGVSKNTLINSNDSLSSKGSLKVGQTIAILPVEGLAYEIKSGDTIESLAHKYNSSVKEILKYNDMDDSSILQIGDTIVLPGGKKPIVKAPEKKIALEVPTEITEVPEIQKIEDNTLPKEEVPAPEKSDSIPSSTGYIWPFLQGVGRVSQVLHDDNAVDISAPKGTDIYSIKDGTVLIADPNGWNGGYGKYVVVDLADGGQLLYAHMSKVLVTAGQFVKQGEILGEVGSTGHSTGPHVHISARALKNPFGLLRKGNTSVDFN